MLNVAKTVKKLSYKKPDRTQVSGSMSNLTGDQYCAEQRQTVF